MKILKPGDPAKVVKHRNAVSQYVDRIFWCNNCETVFKVSASDQKNVRIEPTQFGLTEPEFGFFLNCPACGSTVQVTDEDYEPTDINGNYSGLPRKLFNFLFENGLFDKRTLAEIKREVRENKKEQNGRKEEELIKKSALSKLKPKERAALGVS